MSFESLGLSADILRAVEEQKYTKPTPIQTQAVPVILEGRDILASAQTGTGKTAGFTLPLLERLSANPSQGKQRHVRALILAPTRELAAQVSDSVRTYGRYLSFRSTVVVGGMNMRAQIDKMRRGVDILIATPGRLLDLVNRREVDLSAVEVLVLDEADRMLDMGFIHDIRTIIDMMPEGRQNLLFSATFSSEVKRLANTLLDKPAVINTAGKATTAKDIAQSIIRVDGHRKRELLSHMIGKEDLQQVLVFARTKYGAERLSKQLIEDGISATAIHGDKSQGARSRALADFKKGKARALVATDVAARGLDIDKLSHVINFDLPDVAEDYVHRIGRTGRAGNSGKAISFVSGPERHLLSRIEALLKARIKQETMEGYEPKDNGHGRSKDNGRGRSRDYSNSGPKMGAKNFKPKGHKKSYRVENGKKTGGGGNSYRGNASGEGRSSSWSDRSGGEGRPNRSGDGRPSSWSDRSGGEGRSKRSSGGRSSSWSDRSGGEGRPKRSGEGRPSSWSDRSGGEGRPNRSGGGRSSSWSNRSGGEGRPKRSGEGRPSSWSDRSGGEGRPKRSGKPASSGRPARSGKPAGSGRPARSGKPGGKGNGNGRSWSSRSKSDNGDTKVLD